MIEIFHEKTSIDTFAPLGTLLNGNAHSGNYGHAGRPGQVGGSASSKQVSTDSSRQWFDKPVLDHVPLLKTEMLMDNLHINKLSDEENDKLKISFERIFGTKLSENDYRELTQNGVKVTLDDASDSDEIRNKFESQLKKDLGEKSYNSTSYSIGVYSDDGYEYINNSLRLGRKLEGEDRKILFGVYNATNQHVSRYNMSVFRGETFEKDIYKDLKVGSPLPSEATKAFASTTTDIMTVTKFAHNEQYSPQFCNIIKFNVEAGVPFAYMGAYGSHYPGESEILFTSGVKTKVTKIKEYKSADGTINRIIYADIKKE